MAKEGSERRLRKKGEKIRGLRTLPTRAAKFHFA
jgi:hypothetical protein